MPEVVCQGEVYNQLTLQSSSNGTVEVLSFGKTNNVKTQTSS